MCFDQGMLKVEEIPSLKTRSYNEVLTVRVSHETKRKFDYLKYVLGKDSSSYIRSVIENALADVKLDQE